MEKKEKKPGSWPVFFMVIGMLLIMASPQAEAPASLIFSGLAVIAVSAVFWKRGKDR